MPPKTNPQPADVSLDLDQGTYNRIAAYNAETVQLVQEAEEFAEKMARFHLAAKEDARAAKENYEAALDGIRRLIRERHHGMDELKRGQKMLPFTAAPETQARPRRELDDETGAVRLEDLEITDQTAALLADQGIDTLADLSEWSGPGRSLTDFDGITKAKAKAIEEAVEKFWQQREAKAELEAAFGPDDQAEPTGIPKVPGTPLTPPARPRRTRKPAAEAEAR